MEYRFLGRAGLQVSPLCLGTMNFGPHTTEKDAFAIMDRALDAGINFFDTANVYGRQVSIGLTEEIIGRWFAQGGGRREKTVIATKVYGPMTLAKDEASAPPNQGRGLSAYKIRMHCEGSLRRLQTDHIDLYQMHHIARQTTWEEAWEAFDVLVKQGKVVYMGSSNFAGWHIAKAQEAAKSRHFLGLVSEQTRYNLHVRQPELEVIPACEDYGLGLIPWSPLAGGLLGGALKKAEEGSRRAGLAPVIEQHRGQLERYEKLAADNGWEPGGLALAWLLANPVVTAPIIGPRTMEQLEGAIQALDYDPSDEVLKELDAIWPGPGGPAPEAYAW